MTGSMPTRYHLAPSSRPSSGGCVAFLAWPARAVYTYESALMRHSVYTYELDRTFETVAGPGIVQRVDDPRSERRASQGGSLQVSMEVTPLIAPGVLWQGWYEAPVYTYKSCRTVRSGTAHRRRQAIACDKPPPHDLTAHTTSQAASSTATGACVPRWQMVNARHLQCWASSWPRRCAVDGAPIYTYKLCRLSAPISELPRVRRNAAQYALHTNAPLGPGAGPSASLRTTSDLLGSSEVPARFPCELPVQIRHSAQDSKAPLLSDRGSAGFALLVALPSVRGTPQRPVIHPSCALSLDRLPAAERCTGRAECSLTAISAWWSDSACLIDSALKAPSSVQLFIRINLQGLPAATRDLRGVYTYEPLSCAPSGRLSMQCRQGGPSLFEKRLRHNDVPLGVAARTATLSDQPRLAGCELPLCMTRAVYTYKSSYGTATVFGATRETVDLSRSSQDDFAVVTRRRRELLQGRCTEPKDSVGMEKCSWMAQAPHIASPNFVRSTRPGICSLQRQTAKSYPDRFIRMNRRPGLRCTAACRPVHTYKPEPPPPAPWPPALPHAQDQTNPAIERGSAFLGSHFSEVDAMT